MESIHPDDEKRVELKGFGEYLHFLRAEFRTFEWLFKEFTTSEIRRHAVWMLICLALATACITVQPLIVAWAMNSLAAKEFSAVILAIAAFGLCALVHHAFFTLEGVEHEWVLGLAMCRLDERITELLFSKTLGQHERHGSSLNYASIDKGKWKAVGFMDILVFQGIPATVTALCCLVLLCIMSPLFGLCASVLSALFYVWSLWLNYRVVSTMNPIEREFRRINRVRIERWEKVQRVVTNGRSRAEIKQMSQAMEKNMAKDRAFWIWLIRQFNIRTFLLQRTLVIGALAWGSYEVYRGDWELGFVFPLVMWAEGLNSSLLTLSMVERMIGRDIVPVQLMTEALSLKPSFDVYEGIELVRNGPLKVRFSDLSYSYRDDKGEEHPVLRNISLLINPGEKLALLGPSGAGKTTLMKLLLRFDDPKKGAVLVNDRPLWEYGMPSYMRQVGYIPQQASIFDSTIGENLLYGVHGKQRFSLRDNDHEKLWELMRTLKIDFGRRLTHGLDTLVGHHGLKLSGGQSQRVMIGAAVAKNPRLMVIDEATSSLDSTTEREVQGGLEEALAHGTTALIVAHRLSTVRTLCDRFAVLRPLEELKDGEPQVEAVASSFEELAKCSPTFRRLAKDQGVIVNGL